MPTYKVTVFLYHYKYPLEKAYQVTFIIFQLHKINSSFKKVATLTLHTLLYHTSEIGDHCFQKMM